jgi:hypothetical protein
VPAAGSLLKDDSEAGRGFCHWQRLGASMPEIRVGPPPAQRGSLGGRLWLSRRPGWPGQHRDLDPARVSLSATGSGGPPKPPCPGPQCAGAGAPDIPGSGKHPIAMQAHTGPVTLTVADVARWDSH